MGSTSSLSLQQKWAVQFAPELSKAIREAFGKPGATAESVASDVHEWMIATWMRAPKPREITASVLGICFFCRKGEAELGDVLARCAEHGYCCDDCHDNNPTN